MPRSRAGTHTADMATDGPFGAQSLVFDDVQNGKNQYKVKMGKINRFYGAPQSAPVCFLPSKHGGRQIPGSRFKSFGAATKLIWCRRNFLKIQRLPTFSERRINQAQTIQRTFVHANARSYKSYKENKHSVRHSYSIAPK